MFLCVSLLHIDYCLISSAPASVPASVPAPVTQDVHDEGILSD